MQQISAGQLLCGGLFSTDCLSHWLSSVALSHALVSNTNNRELLLRVHLAIAKDVAPVSLLQQAFNILQMVNFFMIIIILWNIYILNLNFCYFRVANCRLDWAF
jgi:hypothetical protein